MCTLGSRAEGGPWKDIDTKYLREGLGEQPSLGQQGLREHVLRGFMLAGEVGEVISVSGGMFPEQERKASPPSPPCSLWPGLPECWLGWRASPKEERWLRIRQEVAGNSLC